MEMFTMINEDIIADLILTAKDNIVYVAPGLSTKLADAIYKIQQDLTNVNIQIIVDSNPEVCRIGYGKIDAIEFLISNGISLKKVESIRLGIIIVDMNAIIYSPTPLIVEDENTEKINAIKVSLDQANKLLRELKKATSDDNFTIQVSIFEEETNRFVPKPFTVNDLLLAKDDLEKRPPKRFDLEREVEVYKSYFQFVELSLTGVNFSRRSLTIPSKLLAVNGGKEVQERLKTTYKLINDESNISGKDIEEKVAYLRKNYTRSMGKRGSVLLVSNKVEFNKRVNEINAEIVEFSKVVREKLTDELNKTKNEICKILMPGIMKNPPEELKGGISTSIPTKDVAMKYVENEIDKLLPSIHEFLTEMKLHCDFKDVTYEMLNDEKFKENLFKQFPYSEWKLPYENFKAIREKA